MNLDDFTTVATVAAIPLLVAFLFVQKSGWRDLASAYPGGPRSPAGWNTCRTAIFSTVPMDHPAYRRSQVRFVFIVRVKSDAEALHVTTIAPFTLLLPPIRLPWSAIAGVRYFDPSGQDAYAPGAGPVFQLNYDPGYTGHFLEAQIRDPAAFIQLPVAQVQEVVAHFPMPIAPQARGRAEEKLDEAKP
jgi:hypothetical protein